jgi:hypothetical protein
MEHETSGTPPSSAQYYQIRLKGHLDDRWAGWFEGLTITQEDSGDTLLAGPVIDQAALHGLLKKACDRAGYNAPSLTQNLERPVLVRRRARWGLAPPHSQRIAARRDSLPTTGPVLGGQVIDMCA